MKLNADKVDNAVLALLLLGRNEGNRAWKGFDWEAMNRLHEKGFISDPRGKAKSVAFTDKGLAEAERLLEDLFTSEAIKHAEQCQRRSRLLENAKEKPLFGKNIGS
jgi:hypothetical protein